MGVGETGWNRMSKTCDIGAPITEDDLIDGMLQFLEESRNPPKARGMVFDAGESIRRGRVVFRVMG